MSILTEIPNQVLVVSGLTRQTIGSIAAIHNRVNWELNVKKLLLLVLVGLAVYGIVQQAPLLFSSGNVSRSELSASDNAIAGAFENRQSSVQVGGSGNVIKLLPDDVQGSRHQKFIIQLDSGQTLLISHNIDIAPRIDNLNVGDKINFYGIYEWNSKGGLVHWTHHDPNNRHVSGWLNHGGRIYQ